METVEKLSFMKRVKKEFRGQRGFTLLEVLFATGIVTLVVASAVYVLLMAFHMSEESRNRLLALNTARSVLEEIKDTPIASVADLDVEDLIPEELVGGTIDITTNPADASAEVLATVTVTVSWNGAKNRGQTLSITTMRSAY